MTFDPRLQKHIDDHPYPLLFATIEPTCTAFPSPDSDSDLRGAHLLPLEEITGLETGSDTIAKSGIHDGLEIDLVTHDARKSFGQYHCSGKMAMWMEQVLSPLIVHTTPEHEEIKAIAPSCLTKHHAHHYLGFASTQWKLFQKECPPDSAGPPRVKPLLYVYRVLLTGIHLMRTGEIEANLVHLNETFKLPYLPELIERKISGTEKGTLDQADLAFHEREYERLRTELEEAFEQSRLPEQPSGATALNDLLIRLRLR
ncbi:MAG: nucleotidyltransferase domain-containing protein [Planctomycetaceae bacterium]